MWKASKTFLAAAALLPVALLVASPTHAVPSDKEKAALLRLFPGTMVQGVGWPQQPALPAATAPRVQSIPSILALLSGAGPSARARVFPSATPPRQMAATPPPVLLIVPERPTGLVIDARHLRGSRAMGPRILDEDGNVLYPNPRRVPDMGVLQDRGMVAYVGDPTAAPRSGASPLVVPAIGVSGSMGDDYVVAREVAAVICQTSQRHGYLDRWAVSFAVSARP